ncbi:VOC family protein [Thermasporomyces composti]|uniref:Glyoxalase-like domain-containing protein n=1 Tax=Thermasporomyces composti TaxID=696763 RepID=A0A3D9V914_THECX|nr:VOC family protein [Thermasporomyces composti]REF37193.1 hypothetical protein DFJ64_2633 [Thermasporomyces composti]
MESSGATVPACPYGPERAARSLTIAFDAHDPARLAAFWAAVLSREVVEETDGKLLPGDETQLGLRFVSSHTAKVEPSRMQLHLTITSIDDQRQKVETVLRLGGSHLDVGQRGDEGHVVLADPDCNEFCVLEPPPGYWDRAA